MKLFLALCVTCSVACSHARTDEDISTTVLPVGDTGQHVARSRAVPVPLADGSELARFKLDLAAPTDSGECTRRPDMHGEGETFAIYHPSAASPSAFSSITVAPNGDFIRYVDRRGGVTVPSLPAGATRAQTDSVFAAARRQNRSTTINIDYRKGTVYLANEGGSKPESRLLASIGDVARNPKFGSPALQANAILARCRGSGT